MAARDESLGFPLDDIPFSTRGAWFGLSRVVGLHRSAELVHLVSHQTGLHPVVSFQPLLAGAAVEAGLGAAPDALEWTHPSGWIAASFDAVDTLRVSGQGLGLRLAEAADRLTPFTGNYLFRHPADGSAVLTSYETGQRYRFTPISGSFSVIGAEALGAHERAIVVGDDGGPWEIAIEELTSEREPYQSTRPFDEVRGRADEDFRSYLDALAPWRSTATPAAARAVYVLWSATVRPLGFLGRESVLMSKHWMDKVWSWDHCFNALALAPADPVAALDQFLTVFDHQADTGAIPDSITHSEVLFNFVKPPIHGWAWSVLRERLPVVPTATLSEVYGRLARWSNYWLDHRRAPGHALPFYEHGNDSGWDNSTVFDLDRLIESPDLAAFLVLQLDVLADLADELSDELGTNDSAYWREASAALLAALLDELRVGNDLIARSVATGRSASTSSLLTALPILAAARLPAEVVEALAVRIGTHLTAFGPATERPDSPHYEPDGYWRGPIWAPSTLIIEQGLRRAGRTELADTVSSRFRMLCERSGFAENFDALSGAGLRDRAYTWTASAYLFLAGEMIERSERPAGSA